jgi:hypothetical protein
MKSWEWLAPAMLLAFCLPVLNWARESDLPGGAMCGMAVFLVMLLLAGQAVKLYASYWGGVEAERFRAHREALATTAENQWAMAFRGMHPETARLVLSYSKTVWLIDECDQKDVCEWYLKADQRINSRFVVWVLKNSNLYSIMPQHGNLSDKAFNWDRVVSDRLMFQAFCAVLERRQMLTAAHGNQPGLWIEPWNPERVAKRFGVEHLLEEEEGEVVGG